MFKINPVDSSTQFILLYQDIEFGRVKSDVKQGVSGIASKSMT